MTDQTDEVFIRDILKPKIDDRQYLGVILKNKLNVVLISDPTTTSSSASLGLNIGYYSDPIELQGLHNYLSRMLFCGCDKYPDEKFNRFLKDHCGYLNTICLANNTAYSFQIDSNYLEDALDR